MKATFLYQVVLANCMGTIVYCVARVGGELFESWVSFARDRNCLPVRATHTIFITPLRTLITAKSMHGLVKQTDYSTKIIS